MTSSLSAIQKNLKRRKLDGLLVTQPENRRYLSGYSATDSSISETSGVLLIPVRGTPFLMTDSRFDMHARKEAKDFEVLLYPKGLLALLASLLPKLGIKRLGFESHYMLHSASEKMASKLGKNNIALVPLTDLVEKMRLRKQPEEIDKIQKSVLLNEEVFQEVFKGLKPGMTEIEVALQIETTMRLKGAERPSFDTIVAGGPNGALPHAVPSHRPLQKDEPIVIDMGLVLDGYCSDMTRTVVLGTPDNKTKKLFRLVRKAQKAGMAAIKAGVIAKDIDRASRQVIEKAGYGDKFGHGLGHGVGIAVHEPPSLSKRSRKKLKEGMVVTVEPGVYLPGWGGIRLENMVEVRADGCRNFNRDTTFLDI
jgi:Xaa-Pro aminopeptidase